MTQFEYTIKDEIGIHARPAGLLVKAAKEFADVAITVECNGKTADAKKLMALMTMGVKHGDAVKVSCDGGNDAAAAEAMKKFFEENL